MTKTEVEYFHMGPWNLSVGFTTSVKAFKREMKKLGVKDIPQMTKAFSGSSAATHWLDARRPSSSLRSRPIPKAIAIVR